MVNEDATCEHRVEVYYCALCEPTLDYNACLWSMARDAVSRLPPNGDIDERLPHMIGNVWFHNESAREFLAYGEYKSVLDYAMWAQSYAAWRENVRLFRAGGPNRHTGEILPPANARERAAQHDDGCRAAKAGLSSIVVPAPKKSKIEINIDTSGMSLDPDLGLLLRDSRLAFPGAHIRIGNTRNRMEFFGVSDAAEATATLRKVFDRLGITSWAPGFHNRCW